MRTDARSGKKELAALLQLHREENRRRGSQAGIVSRVDRAQSIATTWPANGVVSIRKHLFTNIRLLATTGLLWALATRSDLSRAAQLLRQVALPAFWRPHPLRS
jgi:hypothetical protein